MAAMDFEREGGEGGRGHECSEWYVLCRGLQDVRCLRRLEIKCSYQSDIMTSRVVRYASEQTEMNVGHDFFDGLLIPLSLPFLDIQSMEVIRR